MKHSYKNIILGLLLVVSQIISPLIVVAEGVDETQEANVNQETPTEPAPVETENPESEEPKTEDPDADTETDGDENNNKPQDQNDDVNDDLDGDIDETKDKENTNNDNSESFESTTPQSSFDAQPMMLFSIMSLDSFPSTNDENKAKNQPYVEFVSHTIDSVTLNFVNPKNQTVWFEYQKDDTAPSGGINPNPCKLSADPLNSSCEGKKYLADDDKTYPSISVPGKSSSEVTITDLSEKVSVRMTFGPERNWDFDWVTFDVYNPDPLNKHQMSVSGIVYRDHTLNDCSNKSTCENRAENLGSGWQMNLYKENPNGEWQFVSTAQTNEAGKFVFPAVKTAGKYHVCEVVKEGWTQQTQNWSGTPYHIPTSNLSGNADEGPYCRTITYPDTGNYSNASYFGNVDTKKPVTEVISPDSGNAYRSDSLPVVEAETTDNESGIVQLTMNLYGSNGLIKSCVNRQVSPATAEEEFSCDLSTIPTLSTEGEYYLKINSRDAGGNTSNTITWNFTVDNTPPAAPTIVKPTARQWFKSAPIRNEWTVATDNHGVKEYQIAYAYDDGHTFGGSTCPEVSDINSIKVSGCRNTTTTSRNHQPASSEQGGVTIWVRAIDQSGNVGPWSSSVHYYYDREAPVTDINVSSVVNGEFTVSGTATDNLALNRVYVQLVDRQTHQRVGGTTIHLIGLGTTSPWSHTYTVADLGEGYFAAHVSVTDMAGNSSTAGWTDDFHIALKDENNNGNTQDGEQDETKDEDEEENQNNNNEENQSSNTSITALDLRSTGRSGSRSASNSTSFVPQGEVLGVSTGLNQCNGMYLNSYLKEGMTSSSVSLLQTFLNEHLGLSMPITGQFESVTKDAVIAFQNKYAEEVLKPWGTEATGYVYKTTKWKINNIMCPGSEDFPIIP